jgi:hypothetical protein
LTHTGAGRYYGADYDAGIVNQHHANGHHEYLIAGSVMKCDAIVSIPKLKTHKKAGITVSLKNLIGVNGDKNWLPHHTEGDPERGGDERPQLTLTGRLERLVVKPLRWASVRFPKVGPRIFQLARRGGTPVAGATESVIRSGNWYGNDTLWRTCLDLNKIVLYGNPDGTFRDGVFENQRTHLVIVDGIVAGEGNGPMDPDPVPAGLVVFGAHPASTDAACAHLMGFDIDRIPIVREAFECSEYPLTTWSWRDVTLCSNLARLDRQRLGDAPDHGLTPFAPHFGWEGHIERRSGAVIS